MANVKYARVENPGVALAVAQRLMAAGTSFMWMGGGESKFATLEPGGDLEQIVAAAEADGSRIDFEYSPTDSSPVRGTFSVSDGSYEPNLHVNGVEVGFVDFWAEDPSLPPAFLFDHPVTEEIFTKVVVEPDGSLTAIVNPDGVEVLGEHPRMIHCVGFDFIYHTLPRTPADE